MDPDVGMVLIDVDTHCNTWRAMKHRSMTRAVQPCTIVLGELLPCFDELLLEDVATDE